VQSRRLFEAVVVLPANVTPGEKETCARTHPILTYHIPWSLSQLITSQKSKGSLGKKVCNEHTSHKPGSDVTVAFSNSKPMISEKSSKKF
jgi:hypothetical protein